MSLKIVPLKCVHLKDGHLIEENDPYVVFEVHGQEQRSTEKKTLNPVCERGRR